MATSVRSWRFPRTPQYVAHARYVAAAHAKWLGADPTDVALAISEAFTNAVVHGDGASRAPGEVELVAVRHQTELEILVSDDGPGIEPTHERPGLGLKLIEQVTSGLELRRRPEGGTQVRMSFPIA